MPVGTPYVHWKINDQVDLAEIDPVYLWGTVIETNKGPIDTPVFLTDADQGKRIFNYNFEPFFVNGGQSLVVIRAYGKKEGYAPKKASFDFKLDKDFSYLYVDYDYYDSARKYLKATVKLNVGTVAGETDEQKQANAQAAEILLKRPPVDDTSKYVFNVAFESGRWRLCESNGDIRYYYEDNNHVVHLAKKFQNPENEEYVYHDDTATAYDATKVISMDKLFTKAYNESDITRTIITKQEVITAETSVATIESVYPGDFNIPVSVHTDIRKGYRISVDESDNYTIILSGVTQLSTIVKKINERAQNVVASLTKEGEKVEKVFTQTLHIPPKQDDEHGYYEDKETNITSYSAYAQANKLPIGTIFQHVVLEDGKGVIAPDGFELTLQETITYLADGSNGPWDDEASRLPEEYRVAAHQEALDYLANVKLSGIFCMYGEDDLTDVYIRHVSTTQPQGMNSSEVCKWRTLILGANGKDRTPDDINNPVFNLTDKAIAIDSTDVLLLGQGLIDDGYIPETGYPLADPESTEYDAAALPNQLLPYQCTQYVAGLRSGLFYGNSIFGGQAIKRIQGVGNLDVAPLFKGENKLLWQPANYSALNEAGVLTFTKDYGQISLLDGVTTRQSPLEEDEEGVQSIVKYAKHAVHEVLQTYIGRNITGDLESAMEVAVQGVLNNMATQDLTLVELPDEGYSAFDVDVVLVPKSNAQQILAKAYVYLKLTPVHALRQVEVELTVQ